MNRARDHKSAVGGRKKTKPPTQQELKRRKLCDELADRLIARGKVVNYSGNREEVIDLLEEAVRKVTIFNNHGGRR
jgi:hypothetical protein